MRKIFFFGTLFLPNITLACIDASQRILGEINVVLTGIALLVIVYVSVKSIQKKRLYVGKWNMVLGVLVMCIIGISTYLGQLEREEQHVIERCEAACPEGVDCFCNPICG